MEKKICDTPMTTNCVTRTPEEEIKYLKREIREVSIDRDRAEDRAQQKGHQIYSLVEVMCDLHEANEHLRNDVEWHARRMGEYRDALHDIRDECKKAHDAYINGVCNAGDIYDLANTILDIVKRF